MRRSFEHIVTSMRGLLSQFIDTCMTHPLNVLGGVAAVLSVLFTYIFCVEFAKVSNQIMSRPLCVFTLCQAMKMYITHLLFPHNSVRHAKRGARTARNSSQLSQGAGAARDAPAVAAQGQLVLSQANGRSVQELCDIYCLCARAVNRPMPLPNVLIVGPPGTVRHRLTMHERVGD
jgi:hypothetical protein